MKRISVLIDLCLQRWPESIDISDGELRGDNGFYSHNLSAAWNNAETKQNGATEIDFIVWSIYRAFSSAAREKYINQQYIIFTRELDIDDIKKDYIDEEEVSESHKS